jgi:predicted kinase
LTPAALTATLDIGSRVASVIIHLNGWPGSGKLTVARIVARKLQARLLDNHTLHDVAARLCDRHTLEYWELYYEVRDMAFKRIRALPLQEMVVMTNALTLESDREKQVWAAVKALALDRGVPLVAVTLQCSIEENVRRIASEDRRDRKMTDPVPLMEWRSTLTLLTDGSVRSLGIDNTNRRPDEVADEIVGFVRRIELLKP